MLDIYYSDGSVKKADKSELSAVASKPLWIDVTGITQEEADQLKQQFGIHLLTAEDLVNRNSRIKVESFPEYLFCVFYAIKKTRKIAVMEMDFIIGKNFVISNHKDKLEAAEELKKDISRIERLFQKGPDYLFHRLLDMEVDDFMPVLEQLDERIERIEEEVAKDPHPELLRQILHEKRALVLLKKIVMPQREKIGYLTREEYPQISKKAIPYFRDVYDHAIRVADAVDSYREAVANTFDMYMSFVSNNMNEVMKVLSIIATIALPLTVISGIYGTNFNSLPGSASPYGFWVMVGLMVLMVAGMLLYFRKRKWF